jgi:hypothetical protein
MPYKLVKNQLGGGSFEIFILIAVVAGLYFFFIQTQQPVKEKYQLENYSQSIPSSSPELVSSDEMNTKNRPAVDLKAPGVPYLPYPKHLELDSSPVSSSTPSSSKKKSKKRSKKRSKKDSKKRSKKDSKKSVPLLIVTTPKSPKKLSSPRLTPKTLLTPKSSSVKSSSVKSTGSPKAATVKDTASKPRNIREKFTNPKDSKKQSKKRSKKSHRKTSKTSKKTSKKRSTKRSTKSSKKHSKKQSKKSSSPKASITKMVKQIGKQVVKQINVMNKDSKKMVSRVNKTSKKVEKFTDVNKLYSVLDGYDLKTPLSNSVCSWKCCGHYWRDNLDGMFKKDDPVKWEDIGVGKKYRTSNVTCMGDGQAPPGCRCYTSNQYELLGTRGGNASKEF